MKIIKRDGREVPYDFEKIRAAVTAANDEMELSDRITDTVIGFITGVFLGFSKKFKRCRSRL